MKCSNCITYAHYKCLIKDNIKIKRQIISLNGIWTCSKCTYKIEIYEPVKDKIDLQSLENDKRFALDVILKDKRDLAKKIWADGGKVDG